MIKMKPNKCHWCNKPINTKAKLVEVNLYIGKIKRNGEKRLRQSQWNFHARCFEDCTSIPILPQELKAVVQLPKEMKNEFKNPQTTTRENGHETVTPQLP